jgi:hypothetical protein
MGAPICALLAEICRQIVEHKAVCSYKLRDHKILGCYRHVDDLLIVYNIQITNMNNNFNNCNL